MVVFPHAKINLGLHVLRRRNDGYHDIDTCFYPVPLTDILEAVPSDRFEFHQTGLTIPGAGGDNLCVRAFRLMEKAYGIGAVSMHLHKIIPMGAGLGGGSSDGAFALKLLNEIFDLGLSAEKLELHAAELGSDCPFFIRGKAAIGTGRGTDLERFDLSLKGKFIRLIHPGIHVSTAEAYGSLVPDDSRDNIQDVLAAPLNSWKDNLSNDFCKSIYSRHPVIRQIEAELYNEGAEYACMSGSGSAVFGIFNEAPGEKEHPDYFTWTGPLT